MKRIVVIFALMISFNGNTQKTSKPDTCFTKQEILDISYTLDSLNAVITLNDELLKRTNLLNLDLKYIIKLDSMQINYYKIQTAALHKNIEIYVEREKYTKPKWYDNKIFYFISGIFTTILTAKLIVETVK